MPWFNVTRFQWGVRDRGSPEKIDAENEQEAAERVCGEALVTDGKLGQLRAAVWAEAWLSSKPRSRIMFYAVRYAIEVNDRVECEDIHSRELACRAARSYLTRNPASKVVVLDNARNHVWSHETSGALPIVGIASPI
jgi:hypothetical protein